MQMTVETMGPGVARIVLAGRMDAAGADKIDLQFNAIAGSHRGLIVDVSAVDFLASIGIRTLLLSAKTMQRRGGTLVLLAPRPEVLEVLDVSGVLDLLPVAATEHEAAARIAV